MKKRKVEKSEVKDSEIRDCEMEVEENETESDHFEDYSEILAITPILCKRDQIFNYEHPPTTAFTTCTHPGNRSQEGWFKRQNRPW